MKSYKWSGKEVSQVALALLNSKFHQRYFKFIANSNQSLDEVLDIKYLEHDVRDVIEMSCGIARDCQ